MYGMVVVVMLINNAYKQTECRWLIERRESEGSTKGLIGTHECIQPPNVVGEEDGRLHTKEMNQD